MVHIAVIGTGRVGGEVAYTLMTENYLTELSLVDNAPRVAEMTKEELCHANACKGFEVKINAYTEGKQLRDADLILVSAGFPRTDQMSRRDLVGRNAAVIKEIAESTLDSNPHACYFIITNPVDAMATLTSRIVGKKHNVIGTGTNLETARFRTIISRTLHEPLRVVEAYVGGEHGEAAVALWSTVVVEGIPFEMYLLKKNRKLDRSKCENYMKGVSREIIATLGGTRFGPAGSFIEIIRGIILNTGTVLSYARLRKFDSIPESVFVTIPARINMSLGPDIWHSLDASEHEAIEISARAIYETYLQAEGGG